VINFRYSVPESRCVIPFYYEVSCKSRGEHPEMTLIATVWSPEGFAISADGREVSTDPNKPSEDVQKIFCTPFANGTGFAWAWVGYVGIEFVSGRRYDLKEITRRVMAKLPDDAYLDQPEDYFRRIANGIFYELPTYIDLPHRTDDEVIFVGYLAGKPLWAEIVFQPREGGFVPPVVIEPKIEPRNFHAFAGSKTICKQMKDEGKLSQPVRLSEAITAVHEYAKTCVESKASVPDCREFGGTVHVATVTKDGFSWVVEPANSQCEKGVS
jgi:hypothetical protein